MKYILILLFYPLTLFSQSEFTDSSKFVFNTNFAYSYNKDFEGVGGVLGLSISGRVDMVFEFTGTSYDDNIFKASGTLFYFGYNIKRKSSKSNLKIMLGYYSSSLESDYTFVNNRYIYDTKISGLIGGFLFSARVLDGKAVSLIPSFGFTLSLTSNNSNIGFADQKSLAFEFNIVPHLNENFNLIAAPSLSVDLSNSRNTTIFGFVTGLMLVIP